MLIENVIEVVIFDANICLTGFLFKVYDFRIHYVYFF